MMHRFKRFTLGDFFAIWRYDLATSVFISLASVAGLIFVFTTPLLWGPDETTHVGKVYQIAHGRLLPQEVNDKYSYSNFGYGGYIPTSLREVINYVNTDFNSNGPRQIPGVRWVDTPSDYARFAHLSLQTPLVPYNFSNTAIYSPVSYLPSVAAFIISEVTNMRLGPTIYLARIFDLIFFVAIAGVAIHALRGYRVQWLFFAIALIPTYVYQSSIISADTVTNAVAFALVALMTKGLLSRERLSRFETYMLLVSAALMPITKPTYIFLALLVFIVPIRRLSLPRYGRQIVIGSVIAGLLLYAAWQFNTLYLSNANKWIIAGVVNWWQAIDSTQQVKYIIGHPIDFIKAFVRTVLITDNHYADSIFGRLGFHNVLVPAASQIFAILSMALAVLMSEKFKPNKKVTIILSAVALLSILAIFVSLYLAISMVGQFTIEGVQGRYLMPVLPIVLLIIVTTVRLRIEEAQQKLIPRAIITMSTIGLLLAVAKFYYITWG